MAWQNLVIFSVIMLWLYPTAVRSNVALTVMATWAINETWWLITGDNMPIEIFVLTDCIAICVLIGYRETLPRVIIGLYVVEWPVYAMKGHIHDYYHWMALWALTLTQMVLAGPWKTIRGLVNGWGDVGRVYHDRGPVDRTRPFGNEVRLHLPEDCSHARDYGKPRAHPEIDGETR